MNGALVTHSPIRARTFIAALAVHVKSQLIPQSFPCVQCQASQGKGRSNVVQKTESRRHEKASCDATAPHFVGKDNRANHNRWGNVE
jgi:hypothetical protein